MITLKNNFNNKTNWLFWVEAVLERNNFIIFLILMSFMNKFEQYMSEMTSAMDTYIRKTE